MFNLYQVDRFTPTLIDTYEDGETAVRELLELWHEDDDAKLFVVADDDYHPFATIMRGKNPDEATVSRNGGASQRFLIVYLTDDDGKYDSTIIRSCE